MNGFVGHPSTQAQVELSPNVYGEVVHTVMQDLVLLSDQVPSGQDATQSLYTIDALVIFAAYNSGNFGQRGTQYLVDGSA